MWRAGQGLIQVAPGWVGFVNAVSPDGSLAGGGNYDAGSAFLWGEDDGATALPQLIERLDAQYGTHLRQFFTSAGQAFMVAGISADNKHIVGTAGPADQGQPCNGFLLELP